MVKTQKADVSPKDYKLRSDTVDPTMANWNKDNDIHRLKVAYTTSTCKESPEFGATK